MKDSYVKETSHYIIIYIHNDVAYSKNLMFIGKNDGLVHKFFIRTKYKRTYYRFKYDNQKRITYYAYHLRNTIRLKGFALRGFRGIPNPDDNWYRVGYDGEDAVSYYEDYKGDWYDKSVLSIDFPHNLIAMYGDVASGLQRVRDTITLLMGVYSREDEYKDAYYQLESISNEIRSNQLYRYKQIWQTY